MEVLIFGVANLVALGLFLALTSLPFFLAERAGYKLGKLTGRTGLRWLFPLFALMTAATWALGSYVVFKRDCQSLPKSEASPSPQTKPLGFLLYVERGTFTESGFAWNTAIESGAFQFVDMEGGRRCAGTKVSERTPKFPIEVQCAQHASVRSEFAVHVLRARTVRYWWSPPIFEASIEVTERASGRVLARATDLVFGGGIIGQYLRVFGGDQDFERLSCGYASPTVGPWRPSLASRPRFAEYEAADLALVATALGTQK